MTSIDTKAYTAISWKLSSLCRQTVFSCWNDPENFYEHLKWGFHFSRTWEGLSATCPVSTCHAASLLMSYKWNITCWLPRETSMKPKRIYNWNTLENGEKKIVLNEITLHEMKWTRVRLELAVFALNWRKSTTVNVKSFLFPQQDKSRSHWHNMMTKAMTYIHV